MYAAAAAAAGMSLDQNCISAYTYHKWYICQVNLINNSRVSLGHLVLHYSPALCRIRHSQLMILLCDI